MSLIRISVRRSTANAAETILLPEGSTVGDVMETLDLNFDKNVITRDSEELDRDDEIFTDDELVIMSRKLSSGC